MTLKRKYPRGIIFFVRAVFLAAFLLFSGSALAADEVFEALVPIDPHIAGEESLCAECHTEVPPGLRRHHITTCTRCHKGNIADHPVVRHPIDRPVFIHTPMPLPLTKGNRITCSTCHDPHGESGHQSLLRVEYRSLCIQCHRGY